MKPKRLAAALAAGLLPAGAFAAPAAAQPVRGADGGASISQTFAGSPTVGALFASAGAAKHTCSGAVVASPAGDLVITAAHCVKGRGVGMVFVPGYDAGKEPYGAWEVTAAYAPAGWIDSQSPAEDVAILVTAPDTVGGVRTSLEQVTGASRMGTHAAAGRETTVDAYNTGSGDAPITCTAPLDYDGAYPAFVCGHYYGGTSGGPFLVESTGGQAIVTGVIGGLHQGGCSPDVSYSSAFGSVTWALYHAAVDGAPPSVLPTPGSADC